MTRLLVLVLACGALLISIKAQQDYHTLSNLVKSGVRLAITAANEDSDYHMNFISVPLNKEVTSNFITLRIYLKPTTCAKSSVVDHRDECPFENSKPHINCVVCSKFTGDTFKNPFVDCKPIELVDQNYREKYCRVYLPGGNGVNTFGLVEPGVNLTE
ncbi:cystatin-like protein isoform X13 [Brienomyrus brachyistius]|uniref:cystatin-like protein isoform X13 n=1 Tax=Brienomyrus brachyistius TaxID=42636 RepID=UPI0020B3CEFD|nr:cystatin-like protein isoform X13 [Brienomyrus brachyistius]